MALSFLFDPNKQFQSLGGVNEVGGFLRVFLNGTDDRATTYKNFDGTLNEADIVLDTYGRAVVIVDDTKTYRIEVYNRLGGLMWTVSNYKARGGSGGGSGTPVSVEGTVGEIDVDENTEGGVKHFVVGLASTIKNAITALTMAVNGVANALNGKKDRQSPVSVSGGTTKTMTAIRQDEDGIFDVDFEDIEFPENVKMLFRPSYSTAKNDYDGNKTDFLKVGGIVYMLDFVDNEKAVYISRDGTDLKTLTIDTNNFAETKTFKPAINLGWLGVAGRPSSGKYVKVCEIETPFYFNTTYSTRFHIDFKPIGSSDGESAIFFVSIGDHQDSDTHIWYPDINAGWEYVSKQSTERIAQAVVTTDTTTGKIEVWLELTSGTNAQVFVTALENNSNATGIADNELASPRFKYACEYVQPSDSSWETSGVDVHSYPVAPIQQTLTVLRANLTPALIGTVQYAISRDMNIVFVDTDGTRFVVSKTTVNSTSCKLNGIGKTTNRLDISFVEVTYTFATQTWSVARDDSVIGEAIQDKSYVLDWDDIPSMPPMIYAQVVARMADTYNTNRGILRLRKDGLELFCSERTNVGTVTTFKFDGSKVDTSGPYGIATHAEIVYDSGNNSFTRSSNSYQWNLTAL